MIAQDVIDLAGTQVGYHEKIVNTPVAELYPFRNAYDGEANWTKYHREIGVAQGQPWCGFFCYWCFYSLLGTKADTEAFLHNISSFSDCGGAVSGWANAFASVNAYHENDGYVPKPGDVVIFSDTGYPWSHCELLVDVSLYPNYIINVGGNTRFTSGGSGTESDSAWVARRTRSATATSGFHVRGYCEVTYNDTPIGSTDIEKFYYMLHRKKKNNMIDWWNR